MITDTDLQIANTSYTNKDFAQIFTELVEMFQNLTNEYDPNLTNNADPLFILIEQLAFVADKLNYNIDKNTLEQFITSATQENSVRKITEMLGYNMGYYRSATSQVSFTYKGGVDEIDEQLGLGDYDSSSYSTTGEVKLKAFDTTFKTDDDIVYTLLEDIVLTTDTLTVTGKTAMQGELQALTIDGGVTNITDATLLHAYNLDEQRRIYFVDTQVAENGIFINKRYYNANNIGEESWQRVNNLVDHDKGSLIYKFGFDSDEGRPYLEFPEDIDDIIGDGLEVWYLLSNGELGSASNNTLTELNSWRVVDGEDTELSVGSFDSSCYSISNGSSVGAKDKETINEAYNNFKKTVGTFDTLVSCRDYSNAIYEYEDDTTNEHLISAIQVADVRTDPNETIPILARNSGDTSSFGVEILNPDIDRNALYLHATIPIDSSVSTQSRYNSTYSLITYNNLVDIDSAISENKTLCHDLKLVPDENLDIIVEKATLKVNISTDNPINEIEQSSVISNVKKALYENFNARKVEFGEEIPYDTLQNVMLNADSKISRVTFDSPTLTPYLITGDGTETIFAPTRYIPQADTVQAEHYLDVEIIVNNILAGRIALYGINSSFSYRYDIDYSKLTTENELAFIKAETEVNLPAETAVTLPSNHIIQVVEDSYITTLTYPAYVYYAFKSQEHTSKDTAITKNTVYKLLEDEVLYIYYTDSDDVKQLVEYKDGSVIKANFALYDTTNGGAGENDEASRWADKNFTELVDKTSGEISLYALGTDETIELVERNETSLNTANQYCFWYIKPRLIDNGDNTITIDNEEGDLIFKREKEGNNKFAHILEEGEMFIYPNKNMTTLYVLSTGTKLEIECDTESGDEYRLHKYNTNEYIDTAELENAIASADVGTFEDSFLWEQVNFKYTPLTIIETSMTTFIEDEEVTSSAELTLNNEWISLEEGVSLNGVLDGTKTSFISSSITNAVARVVLAVSGSYIGEQTLESNEYCKPSIKLATKDDLVETPVHTFEYTSVTESQAFQVYEPVDSYGDVVLRTAQFEQDGEKLQIITGEYDYFYNLIFYETLEEGTELGTQGLLLKTIDDNASQLNTRDEYSFNFTTVFGKLDESGELTGGIVDDNHCITIKCTQDDLYISVFDSATKETRLFKETDGEIVVDLSYIFNAVEPDQFNLYQVYISLPLQLAVNPYLESALDDEEILNLIIEEVSKHTTFDYLGTLNSAKLISSYDLLNSFFDYNNLYNPFTIEKIDFDESEFTIVGSSRKVSR